MTLELTLELALGVAATLAIGLVGGVFLTFSDFVMRSLRAVPAAAGAHAMQEINRKVFWSLFMVLLLGMTAASFAVAWVAFRAEAGAAAAWMLGGSLIYLVGVMAVTMLGNVPMNERLDGLRGAAAEAYWADYSVGWTRWNHIRTLASAVAALCFMVGSLAL